MFEPWDSATEGPRPLWSWATPIVVPDPAASRVPPPASGGPPDREQVSPFAATFESDALRLADHRPAYLDLEGPVSGGRGHVTRLLRGRYETEEPNPRGERGGDGGHDASPGHRTMLRLTWFDPESGREQVGVVTLQRRWDELSDDDPARAVWRLRFSPIR